MSQNRSRTERQKINKQMIRTEKRFINDIMKLPFEERHIIAREITRGKNNILHTIGMFFTMIVLSGFWFFVGYFIKNYLQINFF